MNSVWPRNLKLHELGRGPIRILLDADPAARAVIAKQLGLQSLGALSADVVATPWFDGVALTGNFRAVVEQICGVTLDAFEQSVEGELLVRAVPPGSAHAQDLDGGDLELDPEAPDPPDVLESDAVDVAAYVVEHLALELDPFPRKPGAIFEFDASSEDLSPFAALKAMRAPKG